MPCDVYREDGVILILCSPAVYLYKGFYIEESNSGYGGYSKLNKDLSPAKKEGRKFWRAVNDLLAMSDKDKMKFRLN